MEEREGKTKDRCGASSQPLHPHTTTHHHPPPTTTTTHQPPPSQQPRARLHQEAGGVGCVCPWWLLRGGGRRGNSRDCRTAHTHARTRTRAHARAHTHAPHAPRARVAGWARACACGGVDVDVDVGVRVGCGVCGEGGERRSDQHPTTHTRRPPALATRAAGCRRIAAGHWLCAPRREETHGTEAALLLGPSTIVPIGLEAQTDNRHCNHHHRLRPSASSTENPSPASQPHEHILKAANRESAATALRGESDAALAGSAL
jgi:hypothetical protein